MYTQTKERTIYFYALSLKHKDNSIEIPCNVLIEVLDWIKTIIYPYNLYTKEAIKNHTLHLDFIYPVSNRQIQHGKIVSLKNAPRPDIIDRPSGERLKNPRKKDHEEVEEIHFTVYYKNDITLIAIENNPKATNPESIFAYLSYFYDKYHNINNIKREYNLKFIKLALGNFEEILSELKRVSTIQISANKSIFSSMFASYSGRSLNTSKNIELVIKPDKNESLHGVAEDLYLYYSSQETKIEKISIQGEYDDGKKIRLDTINIQKESTIKVELDDNLVVKSSSIFGKMQSLLFEIE